MILTLTKHIFVGIQIGLLMIPIAFWFESSFLIPEKSNILRRFEADPYTISSKESIIKDFCTTVLTDQVSQGFNLEKPKNANTTQERYSSQQSLFLKLLCWENKILPQNAFSPFLGTGEEGYLKSSSFKQLNYPPSCHKDETYHEECSLALLTEAIMTDILNELSILKVAEIYGITQPNFTSQKNLETAINQYTHVKLSIGDEENPFCNGKLKSYPKTCAIMKSNIRQLQKVFKKLKLINPEKLLSLPTELEQKKKKYCIQNNNAQESYNHLFCKLYTLSDEGMTPFIQLVYNELLRYTLFTSYYKTQLLKKSPQDDATRFELRSLQKNQENLIAVTNTTIQQISDLHNSYPLHIGLLSYQEDLLSLRSKLNKLVSPFYSLYYKLQNAQIPS